MKFEYTFEVSHLAHFSGDRIRVQFVDVPIESQKTKEIGLYSGYAIFTCSGVNAADIKINGSRYASFFQSSKMKREANYWVEGFAELERLLRLQWKEVMQALCLAKLAKMKIEMTKAQRKVEKLMVAKEKLQKITGT